MLHSLEFLLQVLRCFMKNPNKIKQIHSHLITVPPNSKTHKATLLYNTLIRAYLNINQPHNCLLVFTHMLAQQALPNSHTFPSLIKASSFPPSLSSLTLHAQAIKRGVLSDPFVKTSLLTLYGEANDLCNAHLMFEEITNPCIVACNAMIDAYAKNDDMGSAVVLFKSMLNKDVVSWTSVVNGFTRNGCFLEAIRFFEKMIVNEDLVKPNEATYVSVLSSCAGLVETVGLGLHLGKQIHGYILRNETIVSAFMGTALIHFYGKAGCVGYSNRVFNLMVHKKVCTWNAIIYSLASNGREREALDMFEEMKQQGFCANEVTFVAVLTACARAKFMELGLEVFQSMSSAFGVKPIMEHYGCVVDMLGRAGLLSEATEFIKNMPIEADASVLGALLGACKIHGAVELGHEIGERLLELQPHHCGQYVMLSNIHAGVERWSQAADLRKAMAEAGIRKIPAYSVIDPLC
ncbi:putative pentatricopeptide repeat-containing protein At1g10330 [Mangifera indica]|uniref:putative pentatricopeptide repeat-containing protein At1g10330 n=1 Tax=Mangifera indica TaxID=29780 RepID=UPI001CFAF17F|nr:putative pentatricopeptide repeat-containing protein At1g10330 [Mangifera indica]